MTKIMREFPRPRIEVEPTDYGFRIVTLRQISDRNTHIRVTNLMFPNAFIIPMSREMTITQWHVPVDDTQALLVRDLHQLRRAGEQGRDAPPAAASFTSCPTTCRARTSTTTTASIRTSRSTRPTRAWAPTSTCTTSGPASRWARSRTAPASISASPTRRSTPTGGCCARRSRRRRTASKPLMVLDPKQRAEPHRACGDRRHRPDRRLAGLLAEDRRGEAPGRELGEWA